MCKVIGLLLSVTLASVTHATYLCSENAIKVTPEKLFAEEWMFEVKFTEAAGDKSCFTMEATIDDGVVVMLMTRNGTVQPERRIKEAEAGAGIYHPLHQPTSHVYSMVVTSVTAVGDSFSQLGFSFCIDDKHISTSFYRKSYTDPEDFQRQVNHTIVGMKKLFPGMTRRNCIRA